MDEQWGFVGCKEKTAFIKGYGAEVGDAYVYTAIDRTSKFLIAFHVGKRSSDDTWTFIEKLKGCISGRPQISTDGYSSYSQAVPMTFDYDVDFAQLSKSYGNVDTTGQRRYSPASITGVFHKVICGNPVERQISTSHVERHNLSTRMANRRMTRLTNAHSKKWENHEAMLALWYCWYNYCRPNMAFKKKGERTPPTTPAMKAGLASGVWTLETLLSKSAAAAL